ncbi:MAG: hypothetical protein WBB18_15875, partial [Nodosilinea sp.]
MHNLSSWHRARLLRQVVAAGIALLAALFIHGGLPSLPVQAQLVPIPSSGSEPLPIKVQRSGKLESVGVQLDGQEL